jgi:hypothetical protein
MRLFLLLLWLAISAAVAQVVFQLLGGPAFPALFPAGFRLQSVLCGAIGVGVFLAGVAIITRFFPKADQRPAPLNWLGKKITCGSCGTTFLIKKKYPITSSQYAIMVGNYYAAVTDYYVVECPACKQECFLCCKNP